MRLHSLTIPTRLVIFSLAVIVAIFVACAFYAPPKLYPPLTDRKLSQLRLTDRERLEVQNNRLKLQNDFRSALFQGVGALLVLAGAGIGAAVSLRQLQLNREGQITERFTRAIDQLGNVKIEVILGGIYALGAIAEDSERNRTPVAEALSAYIQSHAPWPPTGSRPSATTPIQDLREMRTDAPDVQAAMSILGAHERAWHRTPYLRLRYLDLRRISLEDAHFDKADLNESHLERAWLVRANFEEARLRRATLEGANLRGANLKGAWLSGANLISVKLDGAQLKGARANRQTVWPRGFDPARAGVIVDP